MSQPQDHFRVILLRPKDSLNIGSVARAMMNFCFKDLAIVAPRGIDFELSKITARRSSSVIESAKIYQTLQPALHDVSCVIGFSTKDSKNTPPVISLTDINNHLRSINLHSKQKIALLFGPEDTGLCYEDLTVCNFLVRIPSSDLYDSLNLAQAAMLVFYELAKDNTNLKPFYTEELATADNLIVLDRIIEQISEKSQFKNAGTPDNTMNLLKNLFRRPQITARELQIILGFFSRILKS